MYGGSVINIFAVELEIVYCFEFELLRMQTCWFTLYRWRAIVCSHTDASLVRDVTDWVKIAALMTLFLDFQMLIFINELDHKSTEKLP